MSTMIKYREMGLLIDGVRETLIVALEERGNQAAVIVGCVHVRHTDCESATMLRLFVRDDRRLKGIGRELVSRAVNEAVMSSCESISLDVVKDNRGVCEFYRKQGFFVSHEYDNGDVIMAKRL